MDPNDCALADLYQALIREYERIESHALENQDFRRSFTYIQYASLLLNGRGDLMMGEIDRLTEDRVSRLLMLMSDEGREHTFWIDPLLISALDECFPDFPRDQPT